MKKILTLVAAFLLLCPVFAAGDKYMNEKPEVRIQNVMAKIRRGEPVTVAVFGGSITTGYNSNPIEKNSWAALTGDWFKKICDENNSKLTFLNEGVSGTDSAFGAARVKDHIVDNKADLVILEFAVNDMWLGTETRMRTYDGVVRQMMNNSNTAVLALFVNTKDNGFPSQQSEQQPLCDYYHIPYVSWKDCILKNGTEADFNKFYDGAETVHPNNAGHASIASYIIEKLESYWKNLPADKAIPSPVKALPKAYTDTGFEFAKYYHKDNIKPLTNTGWTEGTPKHDDWVKRGDVREGWQTAEVGAEMTFEVEGSTIGVTYCESDQFRNAQAWVTLPDGTETQKVSLQCFVTYRSGYYGWAYKQICKLDSVQKVTLHVSCSKRAPSSQNGKPCNITGILCAGKTE